MQSTVPPRRGFKRTSQNEAAPEAIPSLVSGKSQKECHAGKLD